MTYRAGIIGAGGAGGLGFIGTQGTVQPDKLRSTHAGAYDMVEGVEVVAVADVNEENLRRFGELWSVSNRFRYTDYETMLSDQRLDIVSVCTPTFLHHEHVVTVANSAAEPSVIWCEKPIAACVTDAEAMVEACSDAGVELLVNHPRRFNHSFQALRKLLVEDRLLGTIESVNTQFKKELLRNGTHYADALMYLLDSRADEITGMLTSREEVSDALGIDKEIDDAGGAGMIRMENGTFATIDCTVPRASWTGYFHFTGSEGKLYLNEEDDEWRYWNLAETGHVESDLPDEVETGPVPDLDSAFRNAAMHTIELTEGTAENISPGEEAVHALEILVALFISSYTGGRVSFPMDRPLRDVSITSW